MENTQHTAGDWEVTEVGHIYQSTPTRPVIRDGGEKCRRDYRRHKMIASVHLDGIGGPEAKANGVLMAAAPALLAALVSLLDRGATLDQGCHHEGLTNCAVLANARAAIAKATA